MRFQVSINAQTPADKNVAKDGVSFISLEGIRPPELEDIEELPLGSPMNWTDPAAWKFDPPRIP